MTNKILIIDDDEDDCEIMLICLKKAGFKSIIFASTGEEGLEKIERAKPDIVVTDMNLPGIDGVEVQRQIELMRNVSPNIIIMSGVKNSLNRGEEIKVDMDGTILKTADYTNLIQKLLKYEAPG